MKQKLIVPVLVAGLAFSLAACATGKAASDDAAAASGGVETIKIGAAPTPHAKILEFVQENLAEDAGINIEIAEYTDETRLNEYLNDGDLDANYFQHKPYFDEQVAQFGYEITALDGVHIEPYALYSKKYDSIDALPDGATVAVTNDPVNLGRALDLLAKADLVTVKDTGDAAPTLFDIETNKKDLQFTETDPAQLVRSLDDVDAAIINGNYALDGGLNPAADGLLVEDGKDNPYSNFVAIRTADANKSSLLKLNELLHSQEVQDFIRTTWPDGEVLPVS